ncbi:zinc finger and SCAN domain-containing protein 20-like [Eublepharis macularius]|uniref:Zinc finger and SCAN domain-containing protein 20-like n=1 Tax=Eublepharis macularius TaxID=481883 RepID=A0AA97KJU0_EUBMA|nr:zinc finger and SCAN domain-containing protein 20-like [Eublepharis macularius]
MAYRDNSYVKRGISWRHREILDLLHFWGEKKIQEALRNTHRNLDYFERISEQMATRGHRRSALECRSKTKTMRLEYKKVVAHNSRSGNAPITCPYYKELESILRGDANVKPKRLARSTVLQVMGQIRTEPVDIQERLEELFSHDLETINAEDLRSSSPCQTGDSTNQTDDNQYVLEGDLDATTDGLGKNAETEDRFRSVQENWQDKENSPPSPRPAADRTPTTTIAEFSPGTRLANIRRRKRGCSGISNAVDKLMTQSSEEHREEMAQRRKEQEETRKWREEERRRHAEFMEENRQERRMFQESWTEHLEVMRVAVGTLKTLGEAILMQRQPTVADSVTVRQQESNIEFPKRGAPKRSCVGKARERLTL